MATAAELVASHGPMPRSRRGALLYLERARPDVDVATERLPAAQLGYALRCSGERRIVLARGAADPYPWLTLAHELGHLETGALLGFHFLEAAEGYWGRRCEREANAFAAELLLPAAVQIGLTGWDAGQIAAALRVPVWLVELRWGRP